MKRLSAAALKAINYKRYDPDMRVSEISRKVGLSRERVRQILKERGLSTTLSKNVTYCSDCGKELNRGAARCSSCIKKGAYITINCHFCGKEKDIPSSIYKYRNKDEKRYKGNFYCDRTCFYNSRRKDE